ncbi:hypothetical protein [Streptomyces sp. NPDC014734]|uniref:Rv1733c family protein n=1 Tax=Streptomyces sp. NPDC014734 TaxID=3364886 RepID=UPI003702D65D
MNRAVPGQDGYGRGYVTVRAAAGVWRWRRNALCRATDRREAWTALVALLLMLSAAPALGWLCDSLTDESLQRTVRAERAERRATTAIVLRAAPAAPRLATDPEVSSEHTSRTSVTARWKAPDGTERSSTVTTLSRRTAPGSAVEIWTDRSGRPVPRPMDAPTARTHAALAGVGVTLLAVGAVEGCRRLIVRRMVRGRYERIDRDWAAAGPDWGRTGTGG